ncbi:MAG: glycosyltransferase [Anaerolineaceae bacterium]|nr:glycosyltransferase [Anaerolineaceae bacterium]
MRNRMLIDGLRNVGVDVIECHQELWHGTGDRINILLSGWYKLGFWARVYRAYSKLIKQFSAISKFDAVVIGYPGHMDVLLARILTWLKRKPLAWDILMSLYLISVDRQLDQVNRFSIRLLSLLERIVLHLPDMLFIDTGSYREWFIKKYHADKEKFRLLPIGADNRVFIVNPAHKRLKSKGLQVVYYGSYIPNHGTHFIIEAARLLKDELDIRFMMIGNGPDLEYCKQFAYKADLKNVVFIDWLEKNELIPLIDKADVVLGSFGIVSQSYLTIHNKVYEGMAMKKAVITGDSPAIREVFRNKEELLLCKRGDPRSIAKAILLLKNDTELKDRLAENGNRYYLSHSTIEHMGARMKRMLHELILLRRSAISSVNPISDNKGK